MGQLPRLNFLKRKPWDNSHSSTFEKRKAWDNSHSSTFEKGGRGTTPIASLFEKEGHSDLQLTREATVELTNPKNLTTMIPKLISKSCATEVDAAATRMVGAYEKSSRVLCTALHVLIGLWFRFCCAETRLTASLPSMSQ